MFCSRSKMLISWNLIPQLISPDIRHHSSMHELHLLTDVGFLSILVLHGPELSTRVEEKLFSSLHSVSRKQALNPPSPHTYSVFSLCVYLSWLFHIHGLGTPSWRFWIKVQSCLSWSYIDRSRELALKGVSSKEFKKETVLHISSLLV